MRATIVVASILLFTAGLAWAAEPAPVAEAARLETVSDFGEGACGSSESQILNEILFPGWAGEQGFLQEMAASGSNAAAIACPAIISCNATHCVQTTLCARIDTGSNSCCLTGGICLLCLPGQTIHIERCRCAGGGCINAFSQTFFCA